MTRPQRVVDVAAAQQDLARARHVDEFVAHEPRDEVGDLPVVREEAVAAEVEAELAEDLGAGETADGGAGLEDERLAARGGEGVSGGEAREAGPEDEHGGGAGGRGGGLRGRLSGRGCPWHAADGSRSVKQRGPGRSLLRARPGPVACLGSA